MPLFQFCQWCGRVATGSVILWEGKEAGYCPTHEGAARREQEIYLDKQGEAQKFIEQATITKEVQRETTHRNRH